MADLQKIVDELSTLTVLEAAELTKLLEDKWGVSAAAPVAVAAAALLQRLPWLLFGLYAGAIADRVDRKVLVILADSARVAVVALLCVVILTGWIDIAVILVVMFLLGTAEVFADTTTVRPVRR